MSNRSNSLSFRCAQPLGYFCLRTVATAVTIYIWNFYSCFHCKREGRMRDLLFKKGRAYEFRKRHFLALPMMYNLSNEDNSRQKFVKCSLNVCNSFCIFHEMISILYDNNYMKMFL